MVILAAIVGVATFGAGVMTKHAWEQQALREAESELRRQAQVNAANAKANEEAARRLTAERELWQRQVEADNAARRQAEQQHLESIKRWATLARSLPTEDKAVLLAAIGAVAHDGLSDEELVRHVASELRTLGPME